MPIYLRVLSLTDHAVPLQGRHRGPYRGMNADLHTSEVSGAGVLRVNANTLTRSGRIDGKVLEGARVVMAYRHADTGVLEGASEMLVPISGLPWTEIPGFEISSLSPDRSLHLRLWSQEIAVPLDRSIRIHSGRTLVFLKTTDVPKEIELTEEPLGRGPLELHSGRIDQDLTIAPPGGSGIQVRAGQETTD